jgi:hypothetical protein
VAKVFEKSGLTFDDMGLVEVNEAFAAQVLAVLKAWKWDDCSKLNVNGSGISLGHPIGATGARIMTTLTHEMRRRNVRYALETMCRRRPGNGGDLRKGVSVRAATEVALEAMAWTQLVRPGDLVVWSQSSAEPLSPTASLLRSRESIGGFRAKWRACRRRQRCELFALDRLPSKPIETSSLATLRGSLQFSAAGQLVRMPGPDLNVGGSALQRRRARRR